MRFNKADTIFALLALATLASWWLGEGAVEVLDWYAKIAGYVAIGLIVVIVVATVRRSRAKPTAG